MAEPPEYFFDSTGGCARCDAMYGLHKGKPTRPHPYCRCKIKPPKKWRKKYKGGCYDLEIAEGSSIADEGEVKGKIEVEVDTLEQLQEAMTAAPDAVLLDNMPPETLKQAVAIIAGRAVAEASGGITAETVAAVAASGVDLISAGWLTHSAKSLDLGLDIELDA